MGIFCSNQWTAGSKKKNFQIIPKEIVRKISAETFDETPQGWKESVKKILVESHFNGRKSLFSDKVSEDFLVASQHSWSNECAGIDQVGP